MSLTNQMVDEAGVRSASSLGLSIGHRGLMLI
jgi:hypothetical protein